MEHFGFHDKVLRVNLSDKSITTESPGEDFFKVYMGGRNIAAHYLLKEIPSDVEPISDKNKLIVATSILTGTQIPGSSRFTVAAKSPLTGGYGDSETGGWFGPELKFAGYDAIIVEGVSDKPVYIFIKDDKVEIKDAEHLWGKDTGSVDELIKKELNEEKARIIQCGPAGENLVRYANIVNDLHHFCGRTGLGSVMGYKKLRAIAVSGSGKVGVKDKQKITDFARWFAKNYPKHPNLKPLSEIGTSKAVIPLNEMGLLPTMNFQKGTFKTAEKISGESIKKKYGKKHTGCYACPIRCKQVISSKGTGSKYDIEEKYGSPEYESIGSLGSNCGVDDVEVVCKANELCARYGLDTISTGVTIAFTMECYEKGLLEKEALNGLELNLGNGEALLKLIEMITKREGIGDSLAEGSFRYAQKLGGDAVKYSMSVKKQEFPAHEPRGKWGVGLAYALSATGADHLVVGHDSCFANEGNSDDELAFADITDLNQFGITKPLSPTSLDSDKLKMYKVLQNLWSLYNVLDICIFVGVPENRMMTMKHLVELVNAVTGWGTDIDELIRTAERSVHLSRAFNVESKIVPQEDVLPQRMHEPLQEGAFDGISIDKNDFDQARKMQYEMMGWDEQGIPSKEKLDEMKIGWVDDIVSKYRS